MRAQPGGAPPEGIQQTLDDAVPRSMLEHVNSLVRAMGAFDLRTAEHLEAVGLLAGDLALAVGFDVEEAGVIKLAARVHDIGKFGISRSILLKPSALGEDEWREIRLHPRFGASTLEGLPPLRRLAPIVIAHHERVDGTGYPNALRWDEIPPEAQIIAIADAFHAMTVPRPYSQPKLPSEALTELRRCSGTQFNQDYVHVFLEMIVERALRSAS